MDERCNVSPTIDSGPLMVPAQRCETCDEWAVANESLNVGVCGHVDELIDPEDLALFAADVSDYVACGWECCGRWIHRHD